MGRRKGVTNKKTKTASSGSPGVKKTDTAPISLKQDSIIKDDPGGRHKKSVMEVATHFHLSSGRQSREVNGIEAPKAGGGKTKALALREWPDDLIANPPINENKNCSTTSSDQKYLHKKFKRVASSSASADQRHEVAVRGSSDTVVRAGRADNRDCDINREERVQKSNGDNERLRNGFSCNGSEGFSERTSDIGHITFLKSSCNTSLVGLEEHPRIANNNNKLNINNNNSANFIPNDNKKFDNPHHQSSEVVNQKVVYQLPYLTPVEHQDSSHHDHAVASLRHFNLSGSSISPEQSGETTFIKCHSDSGGIVDQSRVNESPSSIGNNSNSSGGGTNNNIGRNVCQYCNLNCTKPSVLEKHIRSHTNERPFPCVPCGFAFKTKSNLYKHCRSRAHLLRSQGGDISGHIPDDDLSLGSDQELSSSCSDEISRAASPMDDINNTASSSQNCEKPYKPKFHKASLYAKDELPKQLAMANNHQTSSSVLPNNQLFPMQLQKTATFNVANHVKPYPPHPHPFPQLASHQMEDLEQHISRIISDNEAIIEDVEPPLQKKYHKITGKSRGNSLDLNTSSKSQNSLALTQLQQFQQMKMLRDESNSNALLARHNQLCQITTNPNANSSSGSSNMHMHNVQIYKSTNAMPVNNNITSAAAASSSSTAGTSHNNNNAAISLRSKPMTQPLNLTKAVVPHSVAPEIQQAKTMVASPSLAALAAAATSGSSVGSNSTCNTPIVHRVSSLTTLITNSLLKNPNITNVDKIVENIRKRCYSESVSSTDINVANHPQNPERSIIKGLLLDWKSVTAGAGSSSSEQTDESVHVCPVCKISFRNADTLKYHAKCYCQGNNSNSAPISPVGSPSTKYARSNSVNVSLPEKYNPNSLVNLARVKLRMPSPRTPTSLAKLAQSKLRPPKPKPRNILITNPTIESPSILIDNNETQINVIQAPLPSPGPLLGKTRLVDTYTSSTASCSDGSAARRTEDNVVYSMRFGDKGEIEKRYFPIPTTHTVTSLSYSQQQRGTHVKVVPEPLVLNTIDHHISTLFDPKRNHLGIQHPMLEMFGGEVHIIPRKIVDERRQTEDDAVRRDLSGGSIISESPGSDSEQSQISSRTPGLFSGGKVEKMMTSRNSPPITPLTPSLLVTPSQCTPSFVTSSKTGITHFQFPPINSITAYNPLTLPLMPSSGILGHTPMKIYAGRLIPDIPGIPGPDTTSMKMVNQISNQSLSVPISPRNRNNGVGKRSSSVSPINVHQNTLMAPPPPTLNGVNKSFKLDSDDKLLRSPKERRLSSKSPLNIWSPVHHHQLENNNRKSFNFMRIADNISPRKGDEIPSNSSKYDSVVADRLSIVDLKLSHRHQLHIDVGQLSGGSGASSVEKSESPNKSNSSSKFLRPTSLPLKPGTFTQKRHHGITPTANTLPLISPETPRPSKTCIQMYINGQAYTYLGLKCSTKPFYCTVNKTQPIYLPHHIRTISMYSQWQTCAESCPHPLGLKPDAVIALYDSRQRPPNYSTAAITRGTMVKASQGAIMSPFETRSDQIGHHYVKRVPTPEPVVEELVEVVEQKPPDGKATIKDVPQIPVPGGYESNEDYEYIKGRGSGRFVCETCGIRCRKPSMLKKHIRTHTNIRPYTCQYCAFSFKTKGNLTKHMKSKSHAKKCEELGINPNTVSEESMDIMEANAQNNDGTRFDTVPGDSDSEDDSDMDVSGSDSDTEEVKTRLPQEEEAARGLLSLSMTPPISINMVSLSESNRHPGILEKAGEDLSVKTMARSMNYMVPKVTFEFPRTEQYYANPNIDRFSKEVVDMDDSSNMPIDLTKPRDEGSSSSCQMGGDKSETIVARILEPAGLLSSLVSITDKIPLFSNCHEMNENKLLQDYLTEKAMHGTKMKQQQKREELVVYSETHHPKNGFSYGLMMAHENDAYIPVDNEPQGAQKLDCQPSGMETLAEIAANSMKLDIKGASTEGQTKDKNLSAKNVASEYLKMATKSTLAKSDREDGESSSDQEFSSDTNRKRTSSTSGIVARKVVVPRDGFKGNPDFLNVPSPVRRIPPAEDGRSVCDICSKTFQKPSQLKLHINIHYLERKYRCEPCAVSFRTQGHLHKHERSVSHQNKVSMTSTFGVPTTTNPRPFKCSDCRVAFRIHGHLAKHLRSKMHVLRLECLCKIPFGTYAEIERAGLSLTEIDTTDCESSLTSLKWLARQLHEKDPTKLKMLDDDNEEINDQQQDDGVLNHLKTSGDESDNDDYGGLMLKNGYNEESLSGNENDKSILDSKNGTPFKRKFGTLLSLNDSEEDHPAKSGSEIDLEQRRAESTHSKAGSNEGALEMATEPPVEKRLKLVQ